MNLEKRIKRHVRSATHTIHAICHPSWADLARQELQELGYDSEIVDPGVLRFEGKLPELYRVHLHARIPVSFRLVLLEFRCGSREDIFRKLRGFPWELWLRPGAGYSLRISNRESRINHEGRAYGSARKAIDGRMSELFPEHSLSPEGESGKAVESLSQKIYLRIQNTRAVLSIDASGELLYRRGWGKKQGHAPLRESLAAAICKAAPFSIDFPIIDAMAGSGTFFTEAFLSALEIPPLPLRQFGFESWPAFSRAAFANQRQRSWEERRRAFGSPDILGRSALIEIDPAITSMLRENLSTFMSGLLDSSSDLVDQLIHEEDFFTWVYEIIETDLGGTADPDGRSGTLLFNPPYRWRIGEGSDSYPRIWNLLWQLLPGWRAIVLVPLETDRKMSHAISSEIPASLLKRMTGRNFPHGGRWIRALYFSPEGTVSE